MKIKLKILSALLAASLVLSACGSTPADSGKVNAGDGTENNQAEAQPEEDVKNVDRAKEIMDGIVPEETCPAMLSIMKMDVDYGEIVKTTYYSTTCERDRNVNIVLPADYSEDKKYPVMYILHGIFGDENSMLGDGNSGARVIIGNMVKEGTAKEMILVFPNMYASKDPNQAPAFDPESVKPYDDFVDDLVNDLMPFMEENYSVATGKKNTAVLRSPILRCFSCRWQEKHRSIGLLNGRKRDFEHSVCAPRPYRIRLRDSSRTRSCPRKRLGDGAPRNIYRG